MGNSIAVNGLCLTVTQKGADHFFVDVMDETRGTVGNAMFRPYMSVNLERAMPLSGRLEGHMVTGHVDGTGTIIDIKKIPGKYVLKIKLCADLLRYVVRKGAVAVDGVSLTVVDVFMGAFSVALIPHTLKETVLHAKRVSDPVMIETDIVGKYILHDVGRPAVKK